MKKLLILAVLGFFVSSTTVFADINPTVKRGSSRARVAEVQRAVNQCTTVELIVDGLWGPRTESGVRSFQRLKGISPVGFVGPLTARALNDCVNAGTNSSAGTLCPNGATFASNCTLFPNNNSVTLCPNGMTLMSNCTVPPSGQTVPLCPNGMTIASNCSSLPGAVNTTPSPSGTEGYLANIARLGSYNNTRISEGDKNIVVYGIEMIARDGDQKIEGFNVSFTNTDGTSSKRLTKYASEVSVWLNGVEIGRKQTSNYSSDNNDVYTYRFTGMNGLVKSDTKAQLTVALSALNSMDSLDTTNEDWAVEAGVVVGGTNSNYISAASLNGRYRDYGGDLPSATIDFQKAGGVSSDQKYKVTTASTSPVAQTVQVSKTSDTSEQVMLAFDVKAENGPMIIQRLPVTISTEGTDATVSNVAVVKSLKLYANGVKLSDMSITNAGLTTNSSCTGSATPFVWCTGSGMGTAPANTSSEVVTFGNYSKLGYKIAANQTVRFEVRADLNDTEDTGSPASDFDDGDAVVVSYNSTNVAESTVELDNYNQDTVQNRSGSATGEWQTLRSSGVIATLGSVTTEAAINNAGEVVSRTVKIPVMIKAFDDTMYLSQSVLNSSSIAGTSAIAFTLEDANGVTKAIPNSATWVSTDANVEGGAYRIDAGTTKNFVLTIVLTGSSGDAQKLYRVQLSQVGAWANAPLTTGQVAQSLNPSNAYESPFFTLNLN